LSALPSIRRPDDGQGGHGPDRSGAVLRLRGVCCRT
jgi:hypothetical protein